MAFTLQVYFCPNALMQYQLPSQGFVYHVYFLHRTFDPRSLICSQGFKPMHLHTSQGLELPCLYIDMPTVLLYTG